ncbi:MAG TPA: FmdB family zinc ribbon protein [Candidatus Limnocylindria bacterium]|nr:FmdB family zinc ribbon protein [Candidatus Limnocylindria bacterium]
MPIYDYRCDHCGHAFSVVLSFTDKAVEVCPSCGKRPRKLLVAPAVVFKGSGWYKTDSRSAPKSEGGSAPASKPETAKEGSGTSSAGGDAPAAAPKSAPAAPAKSEATS